VVFRELWVRRPVGANRLSPATESGGRVFVSGNGSVAAVDARTGAPAWTYSLGNVSSVDPPAYGDGRVFVGTGGHSDSYVYGIDAASGSVAFRTAYGNQWSSWFAPVVSGGTVYKAGGYYGGMYAHSAASGEQRWFQDMSQDDGWTPAVDAGRVYAYWSAYEAGELRVHDAATGALLFSIEDGGWRWGQISLHPTPVVGSQNNVLITQGDRLVSFNVQARTIGWQRQGSFRGTPVLADGMIYVQSDNDVEARRESDGSLAWIWHMPSNQYPVSMFATDNLLFVSTISDTYAVDLAAHQTVWTYPAGGHLTLTRDGILVVAQEDGDLAAIDLK
jgi:outer membrane protein assembly factor BamB